MTRTIDAAAGLLERLDAVAADVAEQRRLAALHALAVLDTPAESVFDEITSTAAEIYGVPIALVSLIDADRQWFKSNRGLPGVAQTPRDISFCTHAIAQDAVFEVPDARLDSRFAANPLVTGEPGIRFYAGAPIVLPGGERIGTVCVIDREPQALQAGQARALQALARTAAACLVERRRQVSATAALVQSEAKYRAIVEDQTELVSLAAPDGTLTYVNIAYARTFGLAPEEVTGRNLGDLVAPQDRDAVMAHLDNVLRRGTVASGMNRMRHEGGEARWIAWTNRPILDDDGVVVGLHSVGRDVTEQRRAEAALAASEQRLRRLYESTPAILHSIDSEGRLLTVSDRWLERFGYTREEVIGRPSTGFLTPESRRKAAEEVLPAFFATGSCDRVAYQFVCRDGSLVDVVLSATLERDAAGAPLRSLSVIEDVTDRKRLAAELSRTHADLDAVVDNVPAMMGYWDAQGVNRYANRDYQSAVGIPLARILGRSAQDVYAAVDPAGFAEIAPRIAKALRGERQEFEQSLLTTTGLRQLHVTYVPRQAADGAPAGYFELAYDITGRKALELRLADSELRYRSLFDNLNTGFALYEIIVDREGRPVDYTFLAVNEAFEPLVGLTAAELLGKRVTEVLPGIERDKADWIGTFGRVALTGETVHFEQYSETLTRWFEVVAYRPAAGQFAVLAHDVTARRKAEMEYRLSEQRLRLLVDAVHDYSMYLVGPDGCVQTWNSGAERVYGYAAADIIGQHSRAMFADTDTARGEAERQLAEAEALGRYETEGWRRRKDGRPFWASVVLTAIHDGEGALLGYAKVTRDLSEQRRQQDLLNRVAELAPSAMLLVDAEGRVQFVNAQTESMFGYAREELIGRPIEQLLPDPASAAQVALRLSVALMRPGNVKMGANGDVQARRKDGAAIDIELGLSGLDTPDGPTVLAAVSDVTEQRRQRARLQETLAEKETLLKEVYHRVKNNLQVVQSLLSLQRRGVSDAPSRQALDETVQRVRAMALVHEKLYQSGNLAAVSLVDYTEDLLRQLGDATGASMRRIRLVADIAPTQTGLDNAIPYGLLVTELVTNCLKHAFDGRESGTVRVSLSRPQAGAPVLSVVDDGVGLPAQFDLKRGGSMGLQLAASLVMQLGGRLEAQGGDGCGFTAELGRL